MQQINLYRRPDSAPRRALGARGAAIALLAITGALLAMWGFAWWQVAQLRTEAAVAHAQSEAQRLLAASQGGELHALSDEQLERLTTQLTAAIEARRTALGRLQAETRQNAAFADRLAALSRRHIDGVWLDGLTLGPTREAMSLSGSALSADLVPRYLHSLARDPALRGGDFERFVIDRPVAVTAEAGARLHFRATSRGAAALPVAGGEPS